MRINILKNINGVKLHMSSYEKINNKFNDEKEVRGYYQILIGCSNSISDIVEFELNKAIRNDKGITEWKEIVQCK